MFMLFVSYCFLYVNRYPLVFAPSWIGENPGTLVLKNSKTGESSTYELMGIAEEPLAEEQTLIECQARTLVSRKS